MSKVNNFLNKVKTSKFEPEKYKPLFKIGDIIVNEKFKVISKIHNIKLVFPSLREGNGEPYKGNVNIKVPHYLLKDYENKAAQKYFKDHNLKFDKSKRIRYKECIRIDKTYKLLDPIKAEILFGGNK